MNLPRLLFRLFLGRRLPRTRGTLTVPGLQAVLRIHRDDWGIPHIEAQNDADAHFGVGFCHGQDRAFQLEMLLRIVRGTLAELVGAAALPVDRLSRRIGFYHAAQQQFPVLDADVREMLAAYACGVAAGVNRGLSRRPHEFVLLRSQPTPWTPLDSLGVIKLISFTLCANWDTELARLRILAADGPEALAALDTAYPEWLPVTSPPEQAAGDSVDRLSQDLAVFLQATGAGGGSNNWALARNRTATGRPLLANDPHLSAALPCHWYLTHVRTPEWAVAGATYIGGPNVISGHNGFAAWGVTAGLIDNTDLFREQISPDGGSVREGDRFVPCPVREELIAIKGGETVTERVLMTPRGPIISPALDPGSEALSLRALWLDPRPVRGLLTLHRVRSFEQFRQELAVWPLASQNVVYADAEGTIGWQLLGQAPRRRKGWGLLPLPGWEPGVGWQPDPVPFAEMPYLVNPTCGFVATANNKPQPEGADPYLSSDYIDGYRLKAINRQLAFRTDWDVPLTQALQADQQDLSWEELRDVVLTAPAENPATRRAIEMLSGWDGRMSYSSPEATVFQLFLVEMVGRLVRARAPKSAEYALGKGLSPVTPCNFLCFRRTGHLVRLLRSQPAGWFHRPWPAEIADALAAVVRRLQELQGEDTDPWAWGRLRALVMHHPLGRSDFLGRVFNLGPVPCGGNSETINQASVLPLAPLEPTDNIASLRVIVDVGAWDNSRFVLPGGQSGNPLSPHYDDLFPLWRRGEGIPIAWSDEEVRRATRETLELLPQVSR